MTTRGRANIYTVDAGRPFLDCLASAILDGRLPSAGAPAPSVLDLPNVTLYLPTRRATRALQDAFLRAAGGKALLLPKVVPVSEGEEDLSLISAAATGGPDATAHAIPAAISDLERRLVLTSLIRRWTQVLAGDGGDTDPNFGVVASTSAQAAVLAQELASLMDMVETENVSLDRLEDLVPDTFSEHWQRTLKFLEVVTQAWPAYLAGTALMSPAGRRNAVIRAEAERLRTAPPESPVIVAGVTGSIPATVDLMRAVAGLPNGAVVLSGLDALLDEASWDGIAPEHPEHPQFGLKTLIDALGCARRDVMPLGDPPTTPMRGRAWFISEAMRPAGTTERWEGFAAEARRAPEGRVPEGLSLIEAPSAQDEAEAVALILREAVETPGRTAALVSPDRLLARRVAVRLEAWGITVDDSAGRPLRKTPPGALLDLVIDAAESRFAPAQVVALLKHPLTRLGADPFSVRRAARALELAAFRAPYLGDGLDGIDAALERAREKRARNERQHPAVDRLWDEDLDGAHDLVRRLGEAFQPLSEVFAADDAVTLRALATAHCQVAEAVAAVPAADDATEAPDCPLWRDDAGATAARFFASLTDEGLPELDLPAADYAELYRSLAAAETVRPQGALHPRLFIWGPFEARLQQADVVVLGSLNEGTWPQAADPGPWLNRPMREALGLPSPEEKNGQAAHDFATLLASPEVVLTRAAKKDGVPTVPSRWLLRMRALLDGMGATDALQPRLPWLHWARDRDRTPQQVQRLATPEPRPAVARRPRKLSVSRIEAWVVNPYAIFAREILGLAPLSPLGEAPGPALRGSLIHDALSEFAAAYPKDLPEDVADELVRFARAALDAYAAHPRIAAFWIPRFQRFAEWFAATEAARREGVAETRPEVVGQLIFDAPAGPFKLTARADRIDIRDAGLVISDYKTGSPPSDKKVLAGAAPQLPLEAAIALDAEFGFEKISAQTVTALRYIRASGGEPPGEQRDVAAPDLSQLAQETLDGLKRHVARFDDHRTPYRPLRRPGFGYDYDDYAHLARVAEWSSGATAEEEA